MNNILNLNSIVNHNRIPTIRNDLDEFCTNFKIKAS